MTLTEIATTDVVTASTDTDARELLEMMDEKMVGSVVITDGDDIEGIVTDRSIALELREADSLDDITAGDVMTDSPVTIEDDHGHFEALEMMSDEGIRRMPIVEDGELAGIVTLDDLVMLTAAELSNASDVIEQQAGPR
ncbi:CBS domain-containing protein [Natrarchaeobaculum aegyptiacum]|uniref:CBS domain-containing protein n=1 Tax=Natrarchaeobaculum aegyptiacum TaxID=745377 RepID=A0A2Z2HQ20_9EURY|nr:CBS domain-containing protein [Natrarchaeobaculum aegyptiacum]ARS88693.1 hypothetical protein B1756_02260 [Natrarchaeobaculum aegyptiacum]